MSSCKNCESRQVGCHGTCSSYKAYRAERDRIKQIKEKEREVSMYSLEDTKKRKDKFVKSRKKSHLSGRTFE